MCETFDSAPLRSLLLSGCFAVCSTVYWFISLCCCLILFPSPISLSVFSQKAFGGTTAPHYWSRNSTAASKKYYPLVSSICCHHATSALDGKFVNVLWIITQLCWQFYVCFPSICSTSSPKPVATRWTQFMKLWGLGLRWHRRPRGLAALIPPTGTR